MSTVHRYISRMRRKGWHRSYYKTLQDIPGRVHCQSIENRTALRFCHGLTAKFDVLSVHRGLASLSRNWGWYTRNLGAFSTWRNAAKQTRPDWTGKGLVNAMQVTRRGITLPDQLEQFAKFICLQVFSHFEVPWEELFGSKSVPSMTLGCPAAQSPQRGVGTSRWVTAALGFWHRAFTPWSIMIRNFLENQCLMTGTIFFILLALIGNEGLTLYMPMYKCLLYLPAKNLDPFTLQDFQRIHMVSHAAVSCYSSQPSEHLFLPRWDRDRQIARLWWCARSSSPPYVVWESFDLDPTVSNDALGVTNIDTKTLCFWFHLYHRQFRAVGWAILLTVLFGDLAWWEGLNKPVTWQWETGTVLFPWWMTHILGNYSIHVHIRQYLYSIGMYGLKTTKYHDMEIHKGQGQQMVPCTWSTR